MLCLLTGNRLFFSRHICWSSIRNLDMLIKLIGAISVCSLVQNNRGLMIIFLSEMGHRIKASQTWVLVLHEVLISLIMCVINTVAS